MNENSNRATLPAANMESHTGNEPVGTKEAKGFDSLVNITVISYRKRKHDPDGISVKAALDGITRAGLLRDDSTSEIEQVTFKSIIISKDEQEKTVIEIDDFQTRGAI